MTLLYDEAPIAISPTLARVFGLNAAVFLQQVHYWAEEKRRNPERYRDSFVNGHTWVYNTIDEWLEQMPFLGSKATFKRMLSELQEKGVLVIERHNKAGFDKTSWYRLNYLRLKQITQSVSHAEAQNEPSISSKCTHAEAQNEPTNTRDYTETTTKTTKEEELKTPHTPQGGLSAEQKFFADSVEVSKPESPIPKQPALKDLPKSSARSEQPHSPFNPLPKHDPNGFAWFWQQYPRRVARAQAIKAWDKLKPDEATKAQILHDLARRKQSDQQWLKDGGAFIPHPTTYLNQGRWTDEPDIAVPVSSQPSRPMSVTEKNLKFLREYRQKHGLEA